MMCPDVSDLAAKALVDIQDTADLILLDFLEGRESGGAATRFAAIHQYAARAMEQLADIADDKPLALPAEWVARLRARVGDRVETVAPKTARHLSA
jgi:hypothetical protein